LVRRLARGRQPPSGDSDGARGRSPARRSTFEPHRKPGSSGRAASGASKGRSVARSELRSRRKKPATS
jgi:hypothetical protein